MKKYVSVNQKLVAQTALLLKVYKQANPTTKTPMADALSEAGLSDVEWERERYIRAARRLKWRVTKTHGAIYENGVKVWSAITDGD